jgi:hypothetical protein
MKPVVKQRTEFFNKPIGVTSIRTGEPEMWQSIAASADARYRDAYQYNAERAKQKGEEQAAAVPTKDLFVIDPNTQKPVALEPPRSFGMIGRQAYENLISRRFEESIQAELESKAQEYAQKYQNSGVFQQEFARHIENMVAPSIDDSGEMSAYGRVINELGAEYLASTTAAMKKREAEIAKAKLKRHNQVLRYTNTRKAVVMAAEGDTVGAKLLLEEEYHRVSEEFMAGEVPFSEFTKVIDQIDGLESLVSTNSLSKYYVENDDIQAQIVLAIQNPAFKDKLPPEIAKQIETALLTTTPTNLVSALNSFDKSMDEYLDKQIEIARNNYLSNINQNTSVVDIDRTIVSVPDNIKPEVRSDLIIEAATQRIHGSISEIGDVGPLADELLNVSFNDTDALVKVLGEEFVAELRELSFEERETIAKGINARSSALNNQRTQEQRLSKNYFDAQILDIESNKTYSIEGRIAKSNEVIAQIQASDFDNKVSKIDAVRRATAQAVRNQVDLAYFTGSELEYLSSLIRTGENPSGVFYTSLTGLKAGKNGNVPNSFMVVYEALKYSAGIDRTATESKIESVIKGNKDFYNNLVSEKTIERSKDAVSGGYATQDDIERLDKEYFSGMNVPLERLITDRRVVEAAKKGVIFPTFAKSIYSNFAGGDSQKSALALQTFAEYQLAEAVVDGQSIQYNLMRKSLDPMQYGMMDAALAAVNIMGVTPAEFSVRQQTYAQDGGNIFDDVKGDLNIPKARNISTAFDALGISISPKFKEELQGALIARKVMGMPVTEESLGAFVDEYVSSMNMNADMFVMAPTIDGMSQYARTSWMNTNDMSAMREQVIGAISDAPEYQRMFTGGTFLDAAVEIFMQAIPGRNAIAMLREQEDVIANLNTDREKTMKMMQILGVDVHYQPVVEAFENGQPAYRAGFKTTDGRFEPFTVNNEFVIVSPPAPDETTGSLLLREINNRARILATTGEDYSRIADPNTRIALARTDVRIQQLQGQQQTLEDFQANTRLFQELTELLEGTGVTLEEIINGN